MVSVNSFRSNSLDWLEVIRYAYRGDIRNLARISIWGRTGGYFRVRSVGNLHGLFDGA